MCRQNIASLLTICFIFVFCGNLLPERVVSAQSNTVICPPHLTQDEVLDGWISLFDGESLYGWKASRKADWKVVDQAITVDGGQRGLLVTTSQFDDFELVLEFKAPEATNSGVFIRTSPSPKSVVSDCYEINIVSPEKHEYSTGAIVGRAKTDLRVASDQWHRMRVLADGAKVKIWIDDENAVEYLDPQPLGRGYIGLQLNSGKVSFRKIALKPLNQKSLLSDKNLKQWKTDQALESKFQINDDGDLQVLGGRGQIESKATFGDCIISLQCKTNAVGLNSGVFFRCIPGDLMNGYESQIQNVFNDGKRDQPADCGTGGIFRRKNARRVNADDKQWFSKTIVATGNHFAVWVNGLQVTDWTDSREADNNPRKGYRAAAGTIILQGHDPTTDILFRNIKAREIRARR